MWIVFLILIGTGLFCIGYFHEGFIHSLGHALLIAGILSWMVDYNVKRRLIREAIRDIDKYLLGYALPSDLQDKVKEIREARIVRHHFLCEFTISPIQDERQIKLETTITFQAQNITNREQQYTAELALEKRNSPKIEFMSCTSNDAQAKYSLKGSDLLNQADSDSPMIDVQARTLWLLPQSQKRFPFIDYEFKANYSQKLPEIGSEYFQFDQPYPTIGATIIVNHPPQFKIHFPSKPKKAELTRSEWTNHTVFLRGAIITIWWELKNK
jgi:hypothetical protein